jgi:hypothetical protein
LSATAGGSLPFDSILVPSGACEKNLSRSRWAWAVLAVPARPESEHLALHNFREEFVDYKRFVLLKLDAIGTIVSTILSPVY